MTLLRYEDLKGSLEEPDPSRRLVVMPLLDAATQLGSGSIDLRLGTEFMEVRRRAEYLLDPLEHSGEAQREALEEAYVPLGEALVLHPGQFILGATLEFVGMPSHLAGQVLGRSSWGRLGLLVATAVVVQPGFSGCLTLELVNHGTVPIRLYPGLRVAQLVVWTLASPTSRPYTSSQDKYKIPLGPQSSKLGWETAERERLERIGRVLKGEQA